VFVDAVLAVKVVAAFDVNEVNAPVLLVVLPIGVLCKLPAYIAPLTPTPPVTTSVPLVVLEDAVLAVSVVAPLAVKLVNAAVLGLV
jgi:hypothetical protein